MSYCLKSTHAGGMNCFASLTRRNQCSVTKLDSVLNVPLTALIAVKCGQFKCVARSAANETEKMESQEEPPLLLGVAQYTKKFMPANTRTAGTITYYRLDKVDRQNIVFEQLLIFSK